MNQATILYIFGWFTGVLAILMLLPLLWAVSQGEAQTIRAFAMGVCFAGFVGGGLVIAFRDVQQAEISKPEIFMLIALIWLTLPLFAAVPFFLGGGFSVINAYFEAVSGFTTTGATILADPAQAPGSVLIWRALLQWAGGFTTLVMIGGLLAPSGIQSVGPLLQPSLGQQDREDGTRRLQLTARALLGPYAILTALCIVLTWLGGIPGFDAFCLGLSTVSTGGFSTVNGSLASFQAPVSEIVLLVFMILGAYNFICHERFLRGDFRVYRENEEGFVQICLIIAAGLVLMFLFHNAMTAYGIPDWTSAVHNGFFMAASLLSTTGYSIDGSDLSLDIPPLLLIAMTLVGGSSLSTAGGLKIVRILAMMKQGRSELTHLIFPHAVMVNRIGRQIIAPDMMASVWAHFAALVFVLIFLSIIVSWTGAEFLSALTAAASALTNAGPLLDIIQPAPAHTSSSYDLFSPAAKLMLAGGMIFGRVEILSFFSILTILLRRN